MTTEHKPGSLLDHFLLFFIKNKIVALLLVILFTGWGLLTAPFDWDLGVQRDPVPVDAIPDIGENQQIVFTQWMGRSPQDIEDQISYPLTSALMGIPGVKTVRSASYFGFSSIYLIFEEDIDFYWSRSRILEKLNSLPSGTLPDGVSPALGPDATALGQIFWYTLEGRDPDGNPTGGWDPQELRSIQDWQVRFALLSAGGVAEVASIGGHVQEYQVDVDPDAMLAHNITLDQIYNAVRMANLDVGARNLEINSVEYFIRGLGFIKDIEDIRQSVVTVRDNIPIYIHDVAHVTLGPAQRRGVLDKGGAEAVGGVVVARYGENPLQVIKNVRAKIDLIAPGLPRKVLADGTLSQVEIVPFYDRTGLINETLGTLKTALSHEILITIIVVLLMVMNLRGALLISSLLPLAVLITFIAMKQFGVDANIVALSGIAIAIGAMVDMGIVIVENILKHIDKNPQQSSLQVIYNASSEVGGAVLTAVLTTVISFLPIFAMEAAEGKLFKPLAFTKTFALLASILISLVLLPPAAHLLLRARKNAGKIAYAIRIILAVALVWLLLGVHQMIAIFATFYLLHRFIHPFIPAKIEIWISRTFNIIAALLVAWLLNLEWLPLGPEKGVWPNYTFVLLLISVILSFFLFFQWLYPRILTWAMEHRIVFLSAPLLICLFGAMIWLGYPTVLGGLSKTLDESHLGQSLAKSFPGLGREFMPSLDEGSFLYMPTTSVHASIGEVIDVIQKQDIAFDNIHEVSQAVGKLGRVESSLDPAPISMIETVINYHPQYLLNDHGERLTFRFDGGKEDFFRDIHGNPVNAPDGQPYKISGTWERDDSGRLIPQQGGMPFPLWRLPLDPDLNPGRQAWPGITDAADIWDQIVLVGKIPGVTDAPMLQPIATRIVMLQTGMRASIGIKVSGPTLESVEDAGLQLEKFLKEVPSVDAAKVFADRIIGKPYLEIEINRQAIARHGILLAEVQRMIEVAIGGKALTSTVEGRERYPVRIRYPRERRDHIDALGKVLVPAMDGAQIPLSQLATVNYQRGPQVIKSENTRLISYVILDKLPGYAEVDVVKAAQRYLKQKEDEGQLKRPAGVEWEFTGNYQNELRANQKLIVVLPLALLLIFLIIYLQFRKVSTSLLVFSGIAVAFSGGFLMIWLYGQEGFLDFQIFGTNMRQLFQIHPINMSVAIWVGFLALFGIATDDGVIIATYLDQTFEKRKPKTIAEIREATLEAGKKRVRPALMTSATTVIALLPILTSTGKGSDIMIPMAIPTFGGMIIVVITIFVVPVLYSLIKEWTIPKQEPEPTPET